MGQQKQNRAQEQRQAFRDQVKALRCPHCAVEFSDAALDWAEAWLEGRFDLMQEHAGLDVRAMCSTVSVPGMIGRWMPRFSRRAQATPIVLCGVTKMNFFSHGIIHCVKSVVLISYGSTPERKATSASAQSS